MWLITMLFAFGAPCIGGGVTFWQTQQATQTAAALSVPKASAQRTVDTPTQVVPRTSRSAMTAPSAPSEEQAADDQAKPAGEGTSLDGFQKLEGCSCRAKAGAVELHLRAAAGGTTITGAGTRSTMNLAFAAKAGSGTPFTLPTTSNTAPASSYTMGRFPLGMGCDDDTLVIATERSVTGWSLRTRTAQWTQTLPESYGDVRPGNTAALDCKSLSVSGGAVSVRAGGKTARLDLESGEPTSSKSSNSKSNSGSARTEPEPKPEPKPDPKPAPADTKPEPPDPEPTPPKPAPDGDANKAGKKKKGKKKKGKKKKGKK